MHIMHALYHIKRQYANIRPRGRDEKQKRLNFFLTLHINFRTKFIFFKQKTYKKRGAFTRRHTNDERKDSLLKTSVAFGFVCAPSRHTNNTPTIRTTPQVHFHITTSDATVRHFVSTNALPALPQGHIIHAQTPKIPANDSYVFYAPIHASQHTA